MSEFLKPCILYQDPAIIIINKPNNMPVHAGRGGGDNLEQYLDELSFGYPQPPTLVHRLDRDTSGCLILAREKESLRRLGKIFIAKRIIKTYWAIVIGKIDKTEGSIAMPLRKQSPLKYKWWMEVHPEGQPALTDYKVLGNTDAYTFLELYPRTGRTHQLRVHCQAIGCPIVGDKIYGKTQNLQDSLHLHARKVVIPFYHNQPPIEVIAPPPLHMLKLLEECGYSPSS